MDRTVDIDFGALSRRMRSGLRRVAMLRRVVRCLICVVYPAALAWWGFCIFGGLLIDRSDYATSIAVGRYVMIGFALFFVAHYAFMICFRALGRQEEKVMRGIVAGLFPAARYLPQGRVDGRLLTESRLFGTPKGGGRGVVSTGYGCIDIPVGDGWLRVADMGVTAAGGRDFAAMDIPEVLYRYFVRPIFGARVESTMHGFRGMFGCCRMGRRLRGHVVLVPDHLEGRLGYLAQAIQGLRHRYGAGLVCMEDPEFERLFVVYADDEVEARRVLTPAVMRGATALRRRFGRDLMLSLGGDMLYFASDIPDGFLRPGRGSLDDDQLLERLYMEIEFCRGLCYEEIK